MANKQGSKTPGAADTSGVEFEQILSLLLHLRGLRDTKEFLLQRNVTEGKKLDDIVFQYTTDNDKPKKLYMQLKFKQNRTNKLITEDNVLSGNNNYNIGQYFYSYLSIKETFSENNDTSKIDFGDCEFILYTNHRSVIPDAVKIDKNNNAMLHSEYGEVLSFEKNQRIVKKLGLCYLAYEIFMCTLKDRKDRKVRKVTKFLNNKAFSTVDLLKDDIFVIKDFEKNKFQFTERFLNAKCQSSDVNNQRPSKDMMDIWDELRYLYRFWENKGTETDFRDHLKKANVLFVETSGNAEEDDVSLFLSRYKFFVGQAGIIQLKMIIVKELGESYRSKLNMNRVYERALSLISSSKNGLTQKDDLFLDAMHHIQLEDMTQGIPTSLFANETITKLSNPICTTNQVVNVVADDGTALVTTLKVKQILERNDYFKKKWIYMTLENFLSNKDKVCRLFPSKEMLVIGGNWEKCDLPDLGELCRIRKEKRKNLVLITDSIEATKNNFPVELCVVKIDDKCTYNDLSDEWQKEVLKRKVFFLGNEYKLKQLVGDPAKFQQNSFCSRTLMYLVEGKDITICKEQPRLSDTDSAYVEILPEEQVKIRYLIEEKFNFYICGMTKNQLMKVVKKHGDRDLYEKINMKMNDGKIDFTNDEIAKVSEKFKDVCGKTPSRSAYLVEIKNRKFFLRWLYNPDLCTKRRLKFPKKVTIAVDALLKTNASSDTFAILCNSENVEENKEKIRSMIQRKFDICFEGNIIFSTSNGAAMEKFEELKETQNNCVVWLKTNNAGDENGFVWHKIYGKSPILNHNSDILQPNILVKAIQSGVKFVFEGEADDAKAIFAKIVDKCQKKYLTNIREGRIVFKKANGEGNMHSLEIEEGDLIWKDSKGSLKGLRDYADITYATFREKQFFYATTFEILVGQPGIGKSTLLTRWSEQMFGSDSRNSVIRVDFRECKDTILELQQTQNRELELKDAVHFFSRVLKTDMHSDLTNVILSEMLQNSNSKTLFILFDAIDEISNDMKIAVIKLLKFLRQNSKAKVCVTTRENLVIELENTFCKFSTKFEELTCQECQGILCTIVRDLLNPFGEKSLDKRIKNDVRTFIKKFRKFVRQHEQLSLLMMNPGQLRLMAVWFQEKVDSVIQFNWLTINSIYNEITRRMYLDYFRKMHLESRDGDIEKRLMASFNSDHKCYAHKKLFSGKNGKGILSGEDVWNDIQLVGIIQQTRDAGGVHFIHQTFEEYFAAQLFLEYLTTDRECPCKTDWAIKCLNNENTRKDHSFMTNIIDAVLCEDSPVHKAAYYGEHEQLASLLKANPDKVCDPDKLKRRPIHLATQQGHARIINLLKTLKGFDVTMTGSSGKTVFDYA